MRVLSMMQALIVESFQLLRKKITRRQKRSISIKTNPRFNCKQRKLLGGNAVRSKVIRHEIASLRSLGLLITVVYAIATNPDKIESWLKIAWQVLPGKVTHSCMIYNRVDSSNRAKRDSVTVKFKISKKLVSSIGCTPIISQADAAIPLSEEIYQIDKPKLLIFVDSFTEDKGLYDFYLSKQKEAEKWGGKAINSGSRKRFLFQGKKAFEMTYSDQEHRRKDISFIHLQNEYTIRYEASPDDFMRYQNQAAEIIKTIEFIDNDF